MKVLITGLFTQAGIFAVRRFGKLGFEVTAADNHRLAYGMYSKYVSRRIVLPSLRNNPAGYAEAIIKELETNKYDFYFPCFEELYLLSNYRDRILALTHSVIPFYRDIMNLHDKSSLQFVVEQSGGNYPETFSPTSYKQFEAIAAGINHPVYIKMKQSRNSTGLRLVENHAEIKKHYDDVILRNGLDEDNLPLIQRRIMGPEIAYSALAQDGEVIGETQHVGIRYIPRSGGTTTCRQSVFNSLCSDAGREFLKQIRWTGFISIDFMIDEATGTPYIIDVNPRPSVCINVGYYGGVDMIPEWVKIAKGEKAVILPRIKTEIMSSTHFADVMWLVYTYTKGPELRTERKKLRKEWWKNRRHIHYDIISREDPIPRRVLNIFLFVQFLRVIFTRLEASNLFLYYNVYNEETSAASKKKPRTLLKQ
jgi:predicted ATP-grasp superfamily ATP-dependent carboligase